MRNMLTENTGIAMMDSGGDNGRMWQRNQGISFANETESSVEFSVYNETLEIVVTKSLYHHLVNTLEFSQDMQERYDSFVENSDDSHYEDIHNFIMYLCDMGEVTIENIQKRNGQSIDDAVYQAINVWNSYNGESTLSQTIQGWSGEINGESFVILQVHGGADVRGGYTSPKIFRITDESFYMFADGYVSCGCAESWYTDDSYNFYADGESLDLKDYKVKEVESASMGEHFAKLYGKDGIILTHDGIVFCPECGKALNEVTE